MLLEQLSGHWIHVGSRIHLGARRERQRRDRQQGENDGEEARLRHSLNIEQAPEHVKRRTWIGGSRAGGGVVSYVVMRTSILLALAAVLVAAPAGAQNGGAAGSRVETLVVTAGDTPAGSRPAAALTLAAGERIAVRIASEVEVGDRDVGPGPVADAVVGEVIARFATSGAFAWPRTPVVWTAPSAGALAFEVNAYPAHRARGEAEVAVLRLGPLGAPPPPGFEPPLLQLDRAPGGARARWADRAGFGVEPATLLLELTTSHGTVYRLDPWVRPGPSDVTLPLPPPGLALPPGVHTLSATIEDRLGGTSPPSTIRFDTP